MAIEKRFRRLGRIGLHEAGIGVRQIETEEMDLAPDRSSSDQRLRASPVMMSTSPPEPSSLNL